MTQLTINILDSAEALERDAWERLCPPADPFLNRDFFAILERHGAAGRACGWAASHLVARDPNGSAIGLLPLYQRGNSHGDFIHDWSWAGAYRQLGRAYYPKLTSGLPHTPATGRRLLSAAGVDRRSLVKALAGAVKTIVADAGFSSWHVAFPTDDEVELLRGEGLIVSDNVQFHWLADGCADFDDYLSRFTAEKRRKVRAERRRVAQSGLEIAVRHGDEVEPREWPALHALYRSTFDKFGNYAVLSSACLAELSAALGRRMVVFIAYARATPVAVAICFRGADTLYGRYWGSNGDYDSLHFELCFYQGIAYCLREGLQRFEPGAGGEHKIARGFTPKLVRSAHWIADTSMRALIRRHLVEQRGAWTAYRDEAAEHLPFRRTV